MMLVRDIGAVFCQADFPIWGWVLLLYHIHNGILQTDGYTGYQTVPCHTHALCWAHARRYFVEAIPPDLPKEDLLGSICKEDIERINEIFAIDKGLAERPPLRNFTIGRKNLKW